MMNIKELSKSLEQQVIDTRRHFHENPETSFNEYETSDFVEKKLNSLGITTKRIGKTGILGILKGDNQGPVIGLRADMDALEITEKTNLPFYSKKDGVMHACGHDAHTAMLLGAAEVLASLKSSLRGTVKFCFQPGEEVDGGALTFIRSGECDDMQAMFCMHVNPDLYAGQVSIAKGPVMAGADHFILKLNGKGGHAATPHLSIDTIVAASAVVMNLQTIVSREADPEDTLVVTVGSLEAGTRFNIIADSAKLAGTVRSYNPKLLKDTKEAFFRIVNSTAQMYRVTSDIEYYVGCPVLVNDPNLIDLIFPCAEDIFGKEGIHNLPKTTSGEDFAYFNDICPVAMAWLGIGSDGQINQPLHHPEFCINEDALWRGVALLSEVAWKFTQNL